MLVAVISTPGVSQVFGCTPVDPLGWGQAFLATGVATAISALAPELLYRASGLLLRRIEGQTGQNE